MPTSRKSEKILDLLERVNACLDSGNFRFTKHALERSEERIISLPDILEVLRNGYHEKIKDSWNEQFKMWDYAITGITTDLEKCRVIVSFDNLGLLVITVIRLE